MTDWWEGLGLNEFDDPTEDTQYETYLIDYRAEQWEEYTSYDEKYPDELTWETWVAESQPPMDYETWLDAIRNKQLVKQV
jgi:hypothetical protein